MNSNIYKRRNYKNLQIYRDRPFLDVLGRFWRTKKRDGSWVIMYEQCPIGNNALFQWTNHEDWRVLSWCSRPSFLWGWYTSFSQHDNDLRLSHFPKSVELCILFFHSIIGPSANTLESIKPKNIYIHTLESSFIVSTRNKWMLEVREDWIALCLRQIIRD